MKEDLSRRLILVIDDDEAIASSLEMILNEEGYRVIAVPEARKALEIVRRTLPGLILLDYRMPGMSAKSFLDSLRAEGRASVPIALLTAAFEGKALAEELGVRWFLPKPFELTTLLDLIQEAVGEPGQRVTPNL